MSWTTCLLVAVLLVILRGVVQAFRISNLALAIKLEMDPHVVQYHVDALTDFTMEILEYSPRARRQSEIEIRSALAWGIKPDEIRRVILGVAIDLIKASQEHPNNEAQYPRDTSTLDRIKFYQSHFC